MDKLKGRLPSPSSTAVDVCTGHTLPLGGGQGDQGRDDERTTLKLRLAPNVKLQRTVFLATGPATLRERPLLPTTLRGHVQTARPPALRTSTGTSFDPSKASKLRPQPPQPTQPTQAGPPTSAPELGIRVPAAAPDDVDVRARQAVESARSKLACAPRVEAVWGLTTLTRTLRHGSQAGEPRALDVELRWEALKAELVAHAARLHPVTPSEIEVEDAQTSDHPAPLRVAFMALALFGLGLWPLHWTTVARGHFERYAGLLDQRSQLQGQVAAVHVAPGQHVAAGAPLLTLAANDLDAELAALEWTLTEREAAHHQAERIEAQQRAEHELARTEAMSGTGARIAARHSELTTLENKRSELIDSPGASPLKLAAVDDQVDVARAALRREQAEQERLLQELEATFVLSSAAETLRLAHDLAALRDTRSTLERRRADAVIRASRAGTVTELLAAAGARLERATVVARLLPDDRPLSMVVLFDHLPDELAQPTRASLATLASVRFGSDKRPAAAAFRARILRVTRYPSTGTRQPHTPAPGAALAVELAPEGGDPQRIAADLRETARVELAIEREHAAWELLAAAVRSIWR